MNNTNKNDSYEKYNTITLLEKLLYETNFSEKTNLKEILRVKLFESGLLMKTKL